MKRLVAVAVALVLVAGCTKAWRRTEPGQWATLPASPLSARSPAVSVWTGSEMLVWRGTGAGSDVCGFGAENEIRCGDPARNDGAAFDPSTGRWRALAAGPLPDSAGSEVSAEGVWTGSEMAIWGLKEAVGAAYDPATDRWRPMSKGPLAARREFSVAWTGTELVVAGGLSPTGFSAPEPLLDAAAWNPVTDQWRRLPDLPSTPRWATLAVVGGVIYVLGGLSLSDSVAEVLALPPGASAWEERAPVGPSANAGYVVAGDTIVVVRSDLESAGAARYDAAHDRWVPLDTPPWAPSSATRLVWTGREVIVLAGAGPFLHPPPGAPDGVALDPRTGHWRVLPRAPLAGFAERTSMAVLWTGTAVLAWGGEVAHGLGSAVTNDGLLYAPAT